MKLVSEPTYNYILVKITGEEVSNTLEIIKKEFKNAAPAVPFNFSFLDEQVNRQYTLEERWSKIVSYSTILAILIACSGLFGLTLLIVLRRTKEIGIRKVLGASIPRITRSINIEFISLVCIANLTAWPAAYFAVKMMLENYVYRVNLEIWVFAVSSVIALLTSAATISFLAVKAARANPVDSLRYE